MQAFTTDWLASSPVFYNEKTGKVSENVNDVIDFRNLEFHPEGLCNFLDFGYSVLDQTPVMNVKFLRHSASLTRDAEGRLRVENLPDPAESYVGRETTEEEVLDLLRRRIQEWERSVDGDIVIPTSGGYDSRLLNYLIGDKSRIRSFTYGLSADQARSSEVVYARKVAEILGTRWEQVELGAFHDYMDDFDALLGCASHCHGMYHIEFYSRIRERIGSGRPLLSGIIGDAWAGSVKIPAIDDISKVIFLGYTHGAHADSRMSRVRAGRDLLRTYLASHAERLQDPRWRVIEAMRFKMTMLSYLVRVPHALGFHPRSPYLDIDIALGMLGLPDVRRRKRLWQKELFERHGLGVEQLGLKADSAVTMYRSVAYGQRLPPLDAKLLSELVEPRYVERINRRICCSVLAANAEERLAKAYNRLFKVPKLGGVMWKAGFRDVENLFTRDYYAYLTLRTLASVLQKRNNA